MRPAGGPNEFDDLFASAKGSGPDLTESILGRVEQKRRFLPSWARNAVRASRGGLVLVAAGAILGAAALYNANPDRFDSSPAPLTQVVQQAGAEFSEARAAQGQGEAVSAQLSKLVMPYFPSPRELAIAAADEGVRTLGSPEVVCFDCSGGEPKMTMAIPVEGGEVPSELRPCSVTISRSVLHAAVEDSSVRISTVTDGSDGIVEVAYRTASSEDDLLYVP